MSCCKVLDLCSPCVCDGVGLSDVLPVVEDNERVEIRPIPMLPECDLCVSCADGKAVE